MEDHSPSVGTVGTNPPGSDPSKPDPLRLPALSEPASFTVAITIGGELFGVPAESASAAVEVTRFFLDREPTSSPGWGPSWSKTTRLDYIVLFLHHRGAVHVAFARTGHIMSDSVPTSCGERITTLDADFNHRGYPCATCLAQWRTGFARLNTTGTNLRWS